MIKVIVENVCLVVIIAAIVCGCTSGILSGPLMTEFGTYVALEQMNNSSALLLRVYNQIRHALFVVDVAAIAIAIIVAIRNIYKFTKENTDENT